MLIASVEFSHSVMSDSLQPHGPQHARLPCLSPTPGACSNSCPLSQWCHPTISSSAISFSSHLQSLPVSGSFPMSQFFTSGGQSTRASASASVLPMNIQDWFPLGLTGLTSLLSKGLSRDFSNTTVQKHLWKEEIRSIQLLGSWCYMESAAIQTDHLKVNIITARATVKLSLRKKLISQ